MHSHVGPTRRLTRAGATVIIAALTIPLAACDVERPAPLTIAATATAHEPVPSGDLDLVVEHATTALLPGDGLVRVIVQGRPPVDVDLTPMRSTEVEADPAKAAEKVEELLPKVDHLLAKGAASEGLNPLGVLDQALEVTPSGGTVLMLGSGISTVDPFALQDAGDWGVDPAGFVADVPADAIPDATDRHVVWLGIGYGDPAGGQISAGPSARRALTTLWKAVCTAANASSCTFLSGPAGTGAPNVGLPVPVVEFNHIQTRCAGSITISAEVAFAADSARLLSGVDSVLAPIAASLDSCPAGRTINAFGHAAEVPGAGSGIVLSEQRARAVLERLRQLGAPSGVIGAATGYGSASHQIVDNTPGGVYDESLARLNRVVELTITAQ